MSLQNKVSLRDTMKWTRVFRSLHALQSQTGAGEEATFAGATTSGGKSSRSEET